MGLLSAGSGICRCASSTHSRQPVMHLCLASAPCRQEMMHTWQGLASSWLQCLAGRAPLLTFPPMILRSFCSFLSSSPLPGCWWKWVYWQFSQATRAAMGTCSSVTCSGCCMACRATGSVGGLSAVPGYGSNTRSHISWCCSKGGLQRCYQGALKRKGVHRRVTSTSAAAGSVVQTCSVTCTSPVAGTRAHSWASSQALTFHRHLGTSLRPTMALSLSIQTGRCTLKCRIWASSRDSNIFCGGWGLSGLSPSTLPLCSAAPSRSTTCSRHSVACIQRRGHASDS